MNKFSFPLYTDMAAMQTTYMRLENYLVSWSPFCFIFIPKNQKLCLISREFAKRTTLKKSTITFGAFPVPSPDRHQFRSRRIFLSYIPFPLPPNICGAKLLSGFTGKLVQILTIWGFNKRFFGLMILNTA